MPGIVAFPTIVQDAMAEYADIFSNSASAATSLSTSLG